MLPEWRVCNFVCDWGVMTIDVEGRKWTRERDVLAECTIGASTEWRLAVW
jgi:hypothetical protein